jgi:hypothetical protein
VSDEPLQVPPDLTADSIAVALGATYPEIPAGYASFKGYLGPEKYGRQRLFTDDTFRSWINVAAVDIAARINIPTNERDARSVVYLKRKAEVIRCHVSYAYKVDDIAVDLGSDGLPPAHPPWHHP